MEHKEKTKVELQPLPQKEAVRHSVQYFNGDELAATTWANKYALKDGNGDTYEKDPDAMHHRMAREFARIEKKYPNPMSEEEIYELFKDFRYVIPQGSPMTGIGNDFQIVSLSNCFVIGDDNPADSYGGIIKTDEEQVQLMKRRGGVGHDLSHIRPKGTSVKNSALTSTGIVPFMERFSNSTREVAQDGRRGALMLSISVKHPDAEDFIDAKMQAGKVTGANVSVRLTDEFMQAVVEDKKFQQQYPVDSDNPSIVKETDARKLWEKIIHNAWQSAEPGVMFWDTIIRESVPDCYADLGFRTISTNPCGEIPLCPYDSCRLLAINLYSYVENPFTATAAFNNDLFSKHVRKAQRLMDDLIDLEIEKIDRILEKINKDPESEETKRTERLLWEKIRHKTLQGRRTGFGITAEGDMLAALGAKYGSKGAIDFAVRVQRILALEAYRSSVQMAKERGAFPVFDAKREEKNPMIQRIKTASPALYDEMVQYGRRNIALLTIAPTGTVSICTQTTSGIEPAYEIKYTRRKKVNPNDKGAKVAFVDETGDSWEEFTVFHHHFITWLKVNGYNVEEVKNYTDEQLRPIIEKSPYFGATANDIDWVAKVKMQGAMQQWVDHSISVTVNLPSDVSEELVAQIYETAWKSGCKGMTVYRDGSRGGVLVTDNKNDKEEQQCINETNAPKRPHRLETDVIRFQNDHEQWIAFVGLLNGRPYEIFTGRSEGLIVPQWVEKGWIIKERNEDKSSRYDFEFTDKYGYKVVMQGLSREFSKEFWNYAKLISGILRHGMPLPSVVELISGLNFDSDSITTWKAGVDRALKRYIPDGHKPKNAACPNCKDDALVYQEGCLVCKSCGYSRCG
ncbi:MAG: adenosylcobalamin-dependent ribonucleoside-diphosphate reductase [Bacteroidales bacterium]|nr:adenosylcobalamin-dependent ribonucleoside-diphosphate reductase [Bacteroidales bacterium]